MMNVTIMMSSTVLLQMCSYYFICNDNDDDEVDVEIKEEEPTDCRSNTKTQFANFSGEDFAILCLP